MVLHLFFAKIFSTKKYLKQPLIYRVFQNILPTGRLTGCSRIFCYKVLHKILLQCVQGVQVYFTTRCYNTFYKIFCYKVLQFFVLQGVPKYFETGCHNFFKLGCSGCLWICYYSVSQKCFFFFLRLYLDHCLNLLGYVVVELEHLVKNKAPLF